MVTEEIKQNEAFIESMKLMETELEKMSDKLEQSVPSFSPRYEVNIVTFVFHNTSLSTM